MVVRPSLLHRLDWWLVKYSLAQKIHVAEMKMLRKMCDYTKSDKIRNEVIREKVRVNFMADKLSKARLRWFKHMQRRCIDASMKRCESLVVKGTQRGRSK